MAKLDWTKARKPRPDTTTKHHVRLESAADRWLNPTTPKTRKHKPNKPRHHHTGPKATGQARPCEVCNARYEAVTMTLGLLPNGTARIVTYCSKDCCHAAGHTWAANHSL